MRSSSKYYINLDIIRIISCIAVLLYHLHILKGGYLAVCVFFVMSGYLSCSSALKKEKFSIISYYYNRLKKIYIPLLIIVFLSIGTIMLFPNISWLNLKNETTSVLLGFNNFWQIGANLDYFTRLVESPFMHLWYISILLQFDLIFPILFLILKWIGEKINNIFPCIILLLFTIISFLYFKDNFFHGNNMLAYYSTITRSYSLLIGMAFGFIYAYYGSFIPKFLKSKANIIFYLYALILIFLFIFVASDNKYFLVSMFMVSVLACRMMDYATIKNTNLNESKLNKIVNTIAKPTYEIYLLQYPVIYLFQNIDINLNKSLEILLIILITIVLSNIIHYTLDYHFSDKNRILKNILYTSIIIMCFYGFHTYAIANDNSKEMHELEMQLAENEKLMLEKQQAYANNLKQVEEEFNNAMQMLENAEVEIKSLVSNLNIVGVGDSVMLGAVENLYEKFPNGYFDAKISRTAWVVNDVLVELKEKDMLGKIVVLNLGANGDCSEECKEKILSTIEDRELFWINVTNDKDVHVNDNLLAFAKKHHNMHVIDWNSASSGHPEYFAGDGIHLTPVGKTYYTDTIYNAICDFYLEEYKSKTDELEMMRDNLKNKDTIYYGNDLLLNIFENLDSEAKFKIDKEYTFDKLKKDILDELENNENKIKIVLVFDNSLKFTNEEYDKLIELCKDNKLFIVKMDNVIIKEVENTKIIDFAEEVKMHNNYLMTDGKHLSSEGNNALSNILNRLLAE